MKITVEINEIDFKKSEKINITKIWFFANVNKTDKPLAKFIKKKKINKSEMKKKLQMIPQKYKRS